MKITTEIRELVQELRELEDYYGSIDCEALQTGVCIARVKIELLGEKYGMTRPSRMDSTIDCDVIEHK